MKRLLLIGLVLLMGLPLFAQKRAYLPEHLKKIALKHDAFSSRDEGVSNQLSTPYKSILSPQETDIGITRYDRQTNSTCQNRFFHYDDGTIASTWMTGFEDGPFSDRGTAYNYFDGDSWGEFPLVRVESQRSGWNSYAPLGENGEIIISHISGGEDDGLLINRRPEKGTGDWTEYLYEGPSGGEALLWPSMVTGGVDNNEIHLLAVTRPVGNGGVVYQGLDGALLYSKSIDGGDTWVQENIILDGLSSEFFTHFDGDAYDIAPPRGETIAFVAGGPFNEAFLMKSTDSGESWTKTVIWEHPYPMWVSQPTDTFYCVDGSWDIKLDNTGMAHVVFGINRAHSDGTGTYWFPFIDGVGYWNEAMPAFSGTHEALNPYGDPGSELIDDYNLIGWSQDMDGDGELTFVGNAIDNLGKYYIGLSSMVQLCIGESNQLFLFYSSVTENYDNGLQNFRHLWSRVSPNSGNSWGPFTHLTEDIIHIFDECVFPTIACNSGPNTIYLAYQVDGEPGMAVAGDEDPFADNRIIMMEVSKDEITGIRKNNATPILKVHQNHPNPFANKSSVRVELNSNAYTSLRVVNIVGQVVYQSTPLELPAGSHSLIINRRNLERGVYFYTIKAGNYEITKKMIIE